MRKSPGRKAANARRATNAEGLEVSIRSWLRGCPGHWVWKVRDVVVWGNIFLFEIYLRVIILLLTILQPFDY
jgi:hypothetical protein